MRKPKVQSDTWAEAAVAMLKKIVHQMEYLAGRTNRQLTGVDRTESNHSEDPCAGTKRPSQLAGRISRGLPYGTELLATISWEQMVVLPC